MLRSSIIPTSVCVCVCVCFSRPDRLRDIADRFNLDQEAVLDNVLYARAYTSNHLYHSASYTAFTSFFRICILLEFHKSVKSGSFSMVQISKHICIEMLMFHWIVSYFELQILCYSQHILFVILDNINTCTGDGCVLMCVNACRWTSVWNTWLRCRQVPWRTGSLQTPGSSNNNNNNNF